MKFVIDNIDWSYNKSDPLRSLNVLQIPEEGVEYTMEEAGSIKGKMANVLRLDGHWVWIPRESLTGSYWRQSVNIPIHITKVL